MTQTAPLPASVANAVYDILEAECGAPADRYAFIRQFTSDRPTHEWRFMGALGFGGKIYMDVCASPPMRVSCYPEHQTAARLEMIRRANEALAALFALPDQAEGGEG